MWVTDNSDIVTEMPLQLKRVIWCTADPIFLASRVISACYWEIPKEELLIFLQAMRIQFKDVFFNRVGFN
jgi:hypothetical protein